MTERVLVTGAGGFVGSRTAESLEQSGLEVMAFKGDVRKITSWQKNLLPESVVYLIAGVRTETETDFSVNCHSIECLFNAAAGDGKLPKMIILASSQAVYLGNQTPFNESDRPHPTTIYGQSKLEGEKIARSYAKEYKVPLVILRYSTILGAGVREKSKMSGPLFSWVKAAKNKEPIKVFQDGNQSRDYVHIDDAVNANLLALNLPSGTYNVGGGKAIKLIELATWVNEALGNSCEIVVVGGEPSQSDPKEMFSLTAKLEQKGWKAEKSAKEAVNEFINSLPASSA